jgi:hypothetical protein
MEVAAARHEVSYAGMCGRGHPVGVQWKVVTGKHPIAMRVCRRLAEQERPDPGQARAD